MNKEYAYIQVQELLQKGYSIRDIAHITGMSKSSVGRIVQKLRGAVSGTAAATCPTAVLGTVSQPSLGTVELEFGTLENNENSDEEAQIRFFAEEQERLALEEGILKLMCQQEAQTYYDNFLEYTQTYLSFHFNTPEEGLPFFKMRQERIALYYQRARNMRANFQVDLEDLFLDYVLKRLYVFFGQEVELVRMESRMKIKEDAALELLLQKATRASVFAPKRDYASFFPDIYTLR